MYTKEKMKCVAIGDIFITVEMMKNGVNQYDNIIGDSSFFYFGATKRDEARNIVKMIEAGRSKDCVLPDGLDKELADAELLMVHLCPVDERILDKAPKLKYVLCNRGGIENIDIDACKARGIKLFHNPAHNANAVAEYTVGLILSETRNIPRSNVALREGIWREAYPNSKDIMELKDLKIGVVGFGNVGKLVCEKLKGFGCEILINTLTIPEERCERINWEKTRFVTFDELLNQSDVITLHARTSSSVKIFTKNEFEKMKPTAYFINTSRSNMVDYDALNTALENGDIRGAAIDVFDKEPLDADCALLKLDNITLTNHRAGDTWNSYGDSPGMMFENLCRYMQGEHVKFMLT